jgi:16S rRNA (guanine527-N7)-methyltransferase
MHPLQNDLQKGLADLGLELDEARQSQLLAYLDLIAKWTQVYNLTAVRDAHEMLTHHLLDSLAVVLPLRRALAEMATLPEGLGARTAFRLLDVGAGAGLPGVVIAITCPEVAVTCVDTVAKKAAFVQQVAASLTLPNLKGLHARVEALTEPYDVVCSRAFASLKDFTHWSRTALAPHGIWLAMKGKHPDAELAELPKDVQVFHVEPLKVPGLDAERCIVWMRG